MRKRTPPPELQEIGLDAARFSYSDRKSWRGPCPKCGGTRRFVIFTDKPWPSWFGMCDLCGLKGWADQINPNLTSTTNPEAHRAYEEDRIQEEERLQAVRERFIRTKKDAPINWHKSMSEDNRKWWLSQGIPEKWQDYWKLGFVQERTFEGPEGQFTRSAYTIPKYGLGWIIRNVDYRIVNPPEGAGKYRQEAGLEPSVFLTRPDLSDLTEDGSAIVVEGSKKAMVTCLTIPNNPQVIGVPSCNSWAGIEEELAALDVVYIVMDPDAQRWAWIKAKEVGKNARIISLPLKIDDAIVQYGATANDLQGWMKQSRPIDMTPVMSRA